MSAVFHKNLLSKLPFGQAPGFDETGSFLNKFEDTASNDSMTVAHTWSLWALSTWNKTQNLCFHVFQETFAEHLEVQKYFDVFMYILLNM